MEDAAGAFPDVAVDFGDGAVFFENGNEAVREKKPFLVVIPAHKYFGACELAAPVDLSLKEGNYAAACDCIVK